MTIYQCKKDLDPISDDDLILSGEEIFLELDRREEANELAEESRYGWLTLD